LSLLRVAIANHEERDIAPRVDQNFTALHDEPEFRKLVAEVGLPALD